MNITKDMVHLATVTTGTQAVAQTSPYALTGVAIDHDGYIDVVWQMPTDVGKNTFHAEQTEAWSPTEVCDPDRAILMLHQTILLRK
ncbi:hypothetical protein [Sphingomonas melonis]|uniref:hypothetical protein n=1 Tax=Sphingomonas melonis TaxID=152682 RepID=UPI0035C800D2